MEILKSLIRMFFKRPHGRFGTDNAWLNISRQGTSATFHTDYGTFNTRRGCSIPRGCFPSCGCPCGCAMLVALTIVFTIAVIIATRRTENTQN